MACRLFGAKPLPDPMLACCQLDSSEQISVKLESEFYHFHSRKWIWTCRLRNGGHFVQGRWVNEATTHHVMIWQLGLSFLQDKWQPLSFPHHINLPLSQFITGQNVTSSGVNISEKAAYLDFDIQSFCLRAQKWVTTRKCNHCGWVQLLWHALMICIIQVTKYPWNVNWITCQTNRGLKTLTKMIID